MCGECGVFDVVVALETCASSVEFCIAAVFDQQGVLLCWVTIPRRHLFQSPFTPISVHCNFAAWIFTVCSVVIGFVHHVVLRHGNLTSVRDVVLVGFLRTLCSSNSLRSNDYVLTILLWPWRILFVPNLDQTLAKGHRQLEPFGLIGVMTFQGIAQVLDISQIFCIIHSCFLHEQVHRSEWSKCLVVLSLGPFLVSFVQNVFRHSWPFFRPRFWRSCGNLFLCHATLHPQLVFLVNFVLSNSNLFSEVSPRMFQWSSMVASWSTSMRVFVCLWRPM